MKKYSACALALLLLLSLCAPLAAAEEAVIDVPRCAAAPEIDGIIGPDEYVCLRSYVSGGLTLLSGNGRQPDAAFYAGWDDEYFYFAVRVSCQAPHSSYQDDEAGHYIFNGHSLMTALVPEDPAADKYRPSNGEYWLWQEAYDAGVCFEWTTILDSRTDTVVTENHFLSLTEDEGFLAACTSADGFDVYEMRIAFSAFSTEYAGAAFEAQSGAVFGLDFNAGLSDVGVGYDGENGEYRGDYVSLGGFFADYRGTNASACARLRLAETAAEESVAETPDTGDEGYVLYVVLAVVAVGAAVAIWIARSRKNNVIDDEDDDEDDEAK